MAIISGGTVMPGNGTRTPLTGTGAPAANFGAGTVAVGSKYLNTTSGTEYICTATNGSTTATWVVTGAQVGP